MRPELVAFDVNETLLDLSPLGPRLERLVGGAFSLGEWFARMLHRSVVANQLNAYRPFGELGVEALMWLAARSGTELARERAEAFVASMADLPPHHDVVDGLEETAALGIDMIALTNGSSAVATRQMATSGLDRFVDRVISVESVGAFKPAPEVYRHAAAESGVEVEAMVLVAAHDWDVAGARAAGARGCFVRRQPWGPGYGSPDLEIEDLGQLAAALEG